MKSGSIRVIITVASLAVSGGMALAAEMREWKHTGDHHTAVLNVHGEDVRPGGERPGRRAAGRG